MPSVMNGMSFFPDQSNGFNQKIGVPQPDTILYVGGLSQDFTSDLLFSVFSPHGNILNAQVVPSKTSNEHKGFGFVTFRSKAEAENAKQNLNLVKVQNSVLRVSFKSEKPDQQSQDANLFIKNLDPKIEESNLISALSEFGDIVSCTIKRDRNGISLGYGYIQFKEKEEAEKCINGANGIKLGELPIQLSVFLPRTKRTFPETKTNLYLKGIPSEFDTKEKVQEYIDKHFSIYGEIVSTHIDFNTKLRRFFAFINFSSPADAESAKKELNDYDTGEGRLFVDFAMNKNERISSLKSSTGKENNLIILSLKTDISEEDVKSAFSNFGDIESVSFKSHYFHEYSVEMGQAFVYYPNKEDAQRALAEGKFHPEVKDLLHPLYRPGSSFINVFQPKESRLKYNKMQADRKQAQLQAQVILFLKIGNCNTSSTARKYATILEYGRRYFKDSI